MHVVKCGDFREYETMRFLMNNDIWVVACIVNVSGLGRELGWVWMNNDLLMDRSTIVVIFMHCGGF